MVTAVTIRGEIRPLEPLPVDWLEGQHVRVAKVEEYNGTPEGIDRDFAVLASLCAASGPADEDQLERRWHGLFATKCHDARPLTGTGGTT
jgi:hypothetical protein